MISRLLFVLSCSLVMIKYNAAMMKLVISGSKYIQLSYHSFQIDIYDRPICHDPQLLSLGYR